MMKRNVSIAIGELQAAFGDIRAIEIAREIGADAVDFSLIEAHVDELYSKGEAAVSEHFAKVADRARELGIEIGQTHGRICIYKNNPELDDTIMKYARLDCMASSILRSPVCVMHGVTTAVMGRDAEPALMHRLNFERFNQILTYAKEFNIKIATETFGDSGYDICDFFGNIKEFIITYNRICAVGDNAKYFTVCVDTGHSNKATRFGNPIPADVIRMLGSSISALHLNDNDTHTDQHKTPMTGSIDWNDVFDALDETGYNGNYNMELNLRHFGSDLIVETAEFSIKVMKNMLKERYGAA